MSEILIQIVEAALLSAVQRSGSFLVCRPGCSQCCHGVFEISPLDADRLREGLLSLEAEDHLRAARIRTRVTAARTHLQPWFPGDSSTGVLSSRDEEVELFEEFASEDACPILDPETQTCDLYGARPILCRTFGPPIRNEAADEEGGLATCELCFNGASAQEIAACEMDSSFRTLEESLEGSYTAQNSAMGQTIIAFAFPLEAS